MTDQKPRRSEIASLMQRVSRFGDVLTVEDADEPILAPAVRAAIYEWLVEIYASEQLGAVGCQPRRSALLYGPPGTGKTTLAHHLAARLGVPLIAVRSDMLVDKYVGSTGQNIGQLFSILGDVEDRAVVLLDEIDSIGSKRGSDDSSAGKERNQFLTVLLTRIEAFKGYMIAATNRKDTLDSALWRRFGMQIEVALPAYEERYAILARYLAPFTLPEESLAVIADLADGASPSLLRQMMEGLKRSVVLAPRLKRDISDPLQTMERVIASIAPPPEFDPPPPLWASPATRRDLKGIAWPPVMGSEKP